MIVDIAKHKNSGRDLGSFEQAIYHSDLDMAFASADPWNLRLLEELVGIKKKEWGVKYWNWPEEDF